MDGPGDDLPQVTVANSCASWAADSSALFCAFHDYSHAVRLDDGNWRLCRDKFSLGHDINDLIGKARFPARSQGRYRGTPRSGGEWEWIGKFTRRAGEGCTPRVLNDESKHSIKSRPGS